MLVLTRKKNESIVIDDDITILVVEIRGNKVRLGVEAPKEVPFIARFLLRSNTTRQWWNGSLSSGLLTTRTLAGASPARKVAGLPASGDAEDLVGTEAGGSPAADGLATTNAGREIFQSHLHRFQLAECSD